MTNQYQIRLKNCRFYAYHGVLEDEKLKGQHFYFDALLTIERPPEFGNDKLDNTVNYAQVFELIEQVVTTRRFDLIETLANEIGTEICREFPAVQSALISVKKPNAPIDGHFDYVEVIAETRND